MSLSGKRAVITGSNSGIGLGIAKAFAAAGADVVLNSYTDRPIDHELAESLAAEFGVNVRYIPADLSKGGEARGLVFQAAQCDILVNNAGLQYVERIEDFPPEKWDGIIAVNLTAAFHTTAVALPMMRKAGWGRIINIASAHGLTASPQKSAYVAAKHGLVGLTKTVALETAEEPITCNAICPGYVLTPLVEAQILEKMQATGLDRSSVLEDIILDRQPSRSFVTVEQIAGAALFMCSSAASQMTGASLSLDGGWTAL